MTKIVTNHISIFTHTIFPFSLILPPQIKDTRELGTQLWLSEWFIWPPAQFVNFYFLPTKYRVVYDNLVSLFYDWYTSHLKHNKAAIEGPNRENSEPAECKSEGLREVL